MQKIIYENYLIDTQGNILNTKTNRVLKPTFNTHYNFFRINLFIKGKKTTFYLHVLLAKAFILDYNPKTDKIKFIDNNSKNCKLDNLKIIRLCTVFPKNKL